jgi:putative flavoprotein involved in K+ transport
MRAESVETVIVGGGQAGLTLSHMLSKRQPRAYRARARPHRRTVALGALGRPAVPVPELVGAAPGLSLPARRPGGFATSGEIVDFLAAYADFIAAPVRCGVTVTALRRRDGGAGFVLETSDGPIRADNVVVATGPLSGSNCPGPVAG